MSWLQSIADDRRSSGWTVTYKTEPTAEEFAGYLVFVEADEHGRMATENRDGRTWIAAYPSYEVLQTAVGFDEVEHVQTYGRQLKNQLRSSDTWAHVGLLWRAGRDAEHVALWPRTVSMTRVAVDPA